jgi:ferredoxin
MIEKQAIVEAALAAGFIRARILTLPDKFSPESVAGAAIPANYAKPGRLLLDAPALLVTALPYGQSPAPLCRPPELAIAPFARRNYYREAVKRLQALARDFRDRYGREKPEYGLKRHYRVFCNSPVPEKPLAVACGLGVIGRNGLVITPEAGSLVIIAALTLPFPLEGDGPLTAESGVSCENCGPRSPCMAACPTGALAATTEDGVISLTPVREGSGLRGIVKTSNLTTEKLLAFRREDKERENENLCPGCLCDCRLIQRRKWIRYRR